AFSLLAFRDIGQFGEGGGIILNQLKYVTVLSATTFDVVFSGQSPFLPLLLEQFVVPRHVWECDFTGVSGDCANGAAMVNSITPGGSLNYTSQGFNVPSADRVSLTFDPVVNNVLIGSGPFECRSVFPSDAGSIGGGCVVNADGTRGIQATAPGADLILR